MKRMDKSTIAAVLVVVCMMCCRPVHANFLTGLTIFQANPDGSGNLGGYANTYGGDINSFNLYLLPGLPSESFNGVFLNSGNLTTLPTRIDIDLHSPGTYSFTALGDTSQGEVSGLTGMNFFFNGNDVNPGISVFAPVNVIDATNFPAFTANTSSSTATLDPKTLGLTPAASSLSFTSDGSVITLTEYRFSASDVYNVDLVSGFDVGSNGYKDGVAEFTLQVSNATVPEPSTLFLLGLGGISLVFGSYQQRRAAV